MRPSKSTRCSGDFVIAGFVIAGFVSPYRFGSFIESSHVIIIIIIVIMINSISPYPVIGRIRP